MKRALVLWWAVVLGVGLGCDKKDGAPAAPPGAPAPPPIQPAIAAPAAAPAPAARWADTSSLWALAPADATIGVVIGDGVGTRVLDAFVTSIKRMEGKPFAKKTFQTFDNLKAEAGFDIFDASAYRQKGFDLSKGAAVF